MFNVDSNEENFGNTFVHANSEKQCAWHTLAIHIKATALTSMTVELYQFNGPYSLLLF